MTLRIHPDDIVAESPSGVLGIHGSWERVRLSAIAEVLNGFAFPSSSFASTGEMPLIRIRDVGRPHTDTWYSGPFDRQYVVAPGSVIVGMDGDFRADMWLGAPALLNQRVCKITVRDPQLYSPDFLRYALPGYLDAINRQTSAVTVKHLSSETVKDLPLPLPPRVEQDRIVAAIEERFSRLDAGVAALERVRDRLRLLRDRALIALVSETGDVQRLGAIAEIRLGRQRSPKNHTGPRLRPYLRAANVTWNGLDLRDVKLMNFSSQESSVYELHVGDVLVAEASGSASEVGKPAIWDGSIADCCFQNTLLRVRSDRFLAEYLYFVLLAHARGGTFARASRGVGIHHLSKSGLSGLAVPVPTLAEQQAIVRWSHSIQSAVARLLGDVEKQSARVRTLRSAVLAAAFSGNLAPQDPNDEPAAILFERIARESSSVNGHRAARNREAQTIRAKVHA